MRGNLKANAHQNAEIFLPWEFMETLYLTECVTAGEYLSMSWSLNLSGFLFPAFYFETKGKVKACDVKPPRLFKQHSEDKHRLLVNTSDWRFNTKKLSVPMRTGVRPNK